MYRLKKDSKLSQIDGCYPYFYLDTFSMAVASVFVAVVKGNRDTIRTLDTFLGSSVFSEIYSRANPRYLNMGYKQLLDCLVYDDGFDWENTEFDYSFYSPFQLYNIGIILTYFQWKYKIDFKDWLKYFSVKDMILLIPDVFFITSIDEISDILYHNYVVKKTSRTKEEYNQKAYFSIE